MANRPPETVYFLPDSQIIESLHEALPDLFGRVGNNFPAFAHVIAFILLTAGIVSCGKRGRLIICASWFLVDTAFEVGQRYDSITVRLVPDWFAHIPFLENTWNYFLRGTFDFMDIVAIVIGTVTAYWLLVLTCRMQEGVLNVSR